MNSNIIFRCIFALMLSIPLLAQAADLCAGETAGTFTFFDQEISRDIPLPKPVTQLEFGKPMFALACLTDSVGPQD